MNPEKNDPSAPQPAEEAGTARDRDAPLEIPWKRGVLFLVAAWAIYRFSWLIFKTGG
jgi:hypothetical protein